MKVVDLHPEELLDKEARGELTELEQERLETHLARCATCRFEREVRADFAEELDGSDEEISLPRLTALVEGLPSAPAPRISAPPPEPPIEEEVLPIRSLRPRRKSTRVALLVAAALFVGGVATAGVGAHVWDHFTSHESQELTVNTPEPTASATSTTTMAPRPSTPAASATEQTVPERDDAPSATAAAPVVAPAVVETPATLFEAASEARRRGDYPQVLALHRRLQAQYPASREAHASQAAVGRLLLDRGDAAGALASFDAYQKHGSGAFDEPVMVGRATALERLGRSEDARDAWRALVAAFPDTPWRAHAEARLASTP